MRAVREALPWSFIGLVLGLAVFLFFVPVPAHGSFWPLAARRISLAELPAFGVMALCLVVILAVRLARAFGFTTVLFTGTTVASFALALPRPYAFAQPLAYMHRVGQSGLFLAIAIALATALVFSLARRIVRNAAPADALAAALVLAVALVLFAVHVSLADALVTFLRPLGALGDTFVALAVITLVEMLLWIVGIHGPATLAAIVLPVYLTLQLQNTAAYAAHEPLPHIVVVSTFLFVFPGGAGATLPLVVMLLFSRVKRLRTIARATILPSLINLNEPLLFGLPIVFNPFLAVPFVLAPLVLATITYVAMAANLLARPAYYIPSSVPTPISTYLATLDARAPLLVLVNLIVATIIYFPFVRAYERHEAGEA